MFKYILEQSTVASLCKHRNVLLDSWNHR